MSWVNQTLGSNVARQMRASTRVAPSIDGHRFSYNDLKELWSSEDGLHIVCTHKSDKVWQHWRRKPEATTWTPVSVHTSKVKAQAFVDDPPPPPGTYLIARADQSPGRQVISIRIESSSGAKVLTDIFQNMGYLTELQTVA